MSHIKQIQEIRDRARQQITEGAVTQDYQLDRKQVISILNEALATELVCVLRYKFHYFMASGIHSQSVKQEFLEHANEEQEHADQTRRAHQAARRQAGDESCDSHEPQPQ